MCLRRRENKYSFEVSAVSLRNSSNNRPRKRKTSPCLNVVWQWDDGWRKLGHNWTWCYHFYGTSNRLRRFVMFAAHNLSSFSVKFCVTRNFVYKEIFFLCFTIFIKKVKSWICFDLFYWPTKAFLKTLLKHHLETKSLVNSFFKQISADPKQSLTTC